MIFYFSQILCKNLFIYLRFVKIPFNGNTINILIIVKEVV